MKYIAIGLTMLLVFGCMEVCAEEYTYKYYVENGIARIEKVKIKELKPLLHLVNCQEIFEANWVEYNDKKQVLFKSKDYIFDKGISDKHKIKLKEVLEYYKKEYDFYARLVVRHRGKQCYQRGKVIFISLEVIENDAILLNWDKEKVMIFILLHEIKHAIDYTHNRKQLNEKRAYDFAKKEINKWI